MGLKGKYLWQLAERQEKDTHLYAELGPFLYKQILAK